ncbi:MAG: hypothetical protein AAGF14_00370 [Pseudomonadota bacterium]
MAWLTSLAAAFAFLAILSTVQDTLLAQEGDGPFVTELKSQNAHLFAKPLKLAKERKPATLKRDYEEKLARTEWQLSDGPVSVEVTLKKGGPPDGVLYMNPVVGVSVDGKQVHRSEGSESFPDNPVFLVQIAEMDPSNPHPEVVFSTYTGGAHCCSDTRVLTSSKDGKTWREISVGPFDGGPLAVSDLDGDGRYEFATRDNAFLYTFGCYACSTAPLLVLALEDGKVKNVSGDAAFRPHQLESLKRIIEWADEGADRNGFLAGYVGQKILLGEGEPAWQLMLKFYDRKSDWGLESCSVEPAKDGACPKEKTVKLTYPEALKRFLEDNDYKLEK